MDEIKFDKRNYRIHNDKNKSLIKKSLEDCGAGRSILVDGDGEIIAGNGVYEQAKALNIPVKVIETDGTELIAVKRTDLKTEDEKRKKLAVMDNTASDTADMNISMLVDDFGAEELADMGLDVPNIDVLPREEDETDEFKEVEKHLCKCPACGHVNEEKAFKYYEDTE